MNPKVLIAVVLLVAAAVVVLVNLIPASDENDENVQMADPKAVTVPEGRTPDIDPEFECTVDEVRQEGKHNVMRFTVRETHGWWVNKNSIVIKYWRNVEDADSGEMVAPEKKSLHMVKDPIPFDKPHSEEITLIKWQDFPDTDLGVAEDWECEIYKSDRDKVVAPL
jgi:hypothetical protein